MTQPILQHFGQVFHHDEPKPASQVLGPGRCTLVATDPGKPQLLSASALSAIQAATVLLVDDLVSESVVALAMPGARVIHVGRRNAGLASPPAFVEKLILMAVHEGEQVVHLQVGDTLAEHHRSEATSRLRAAGVSVGMFSRRSSMVQALSPLNLSPNPHNLGRASCF